jgi:hypothetical protein
LGFGNESVHQAEKHKGYDNPDAQKIQLMVEMN